MGLLKKPTPSVLGFWQNEVLSLCRQEPQGRKETGSRQEVRPTSVKRLRDVDDTVQAKRAKRAGTKRALERPYHEKGQKLLCFGGKSPAAVEQLGRLAKGLKSANHHGGNHEPAAPPRAGPDGETNHGDMCTDTGDASNHRNPAAPQATSGDGHNHRNSWHQQSAGTRDGAKMRFHGDLDASPGASPGGAVLQDPAGPTCTEGGDGSPARN